MGTPAGGLGPAVERSAIPDIVLRFTFALGSWRLIADRGSPGGGNRASKMSRTKSFMSRIGRGSKGSLGSSGSGEGLLGAGGGGCACTTINNALDEAGTTLLDPFWPRWGHYYFAIASL